MTAELLEQHDTRHLGAGDVIEIAAGEDAISALVLLATDEFLVLDRCDGTTPSVMRHEEMADFRTFDPAA
jgi:hypothetical protein